MVSRRRVRGRRVFHGTWECALGLNEELDNDEKLATEGDMSQASRTWAEARQLLNDMHRARGFYPVVGLAAIPSGKNRKRRSSVGKRNTWGWKTYLTAGALESGMVQARTHHPGATDLSVASSAVGHKARKILIDR